MNPRGFTLIELLIVLAIVGIIALLIWGFTMGAIQNQRRIDDLHERWIANCIEEQRKLDAYAETSKITEKCELEWETEILPKLKMADKPSDTTIIMPVTY